MSSRTWRVSRSLWAALTVLLGCSNESEDSDAAEEVASTAQALVCRQVVLRAVDHTGPPSKPFAILDIPMNFRIPAGILVVNGDSAADTVRFGFALGSGPATICEYERSADHSAYIFSDCGTLSFNDLVQADSVALDIESPPLGVNATHITVTLTETTPCVGETLCDGAPIDDVNACTLDSCDDETGEVTNAPVTEGTSCADDTVCNGAEVCDAEGTCLAGTPIVPDDDEDPCTADVCNPITGATSHPIDVGAPCDDGDVCTEDGVCDALGACSPGPALDLDDGDDCTTDRCGPSGPEHIPCAPLDPTVATTVGDSLQFLIEGPNPIQSGVSPGTIVRARAGAIQGRVRFPGGVAAPGVLVRIRNHPELGTTITDAAGEFVMVVNAQDRLNVDFAVAGYLPAQRYADTVPQAYTSTADVMLVPLDEAVTNIDLNTVTEITVVQGSEMTDDRGTRRATILVPPGLDAMLEMSNGTQTPLDTLALRITEYTVGADGPERMSADLPPTSGYTYAAEISADEALTAGAKTVRFSEPISYFLEDLLDMPVGAFIPVGVFDYDRSAWVAERDGIVIEVLDSAETVAAIDLDGDGIEESATELEAEGLDEDQRIELAELYPNGAKLWFVQMNAYGEVETKVSKLSGTTFFSLAYVRDDLGRITQKTESSPASPRSTPTPTTTRAASRAWSKMES